MEEFKYVIKKNKMENFIDHDLTLSSSDEGDNESDEGDNESDEGDSESNNESANESVNEYDK